MKPKRKKPGTAIKRKVQPIPVDSKGEVEYIYSNTMSNFNYLKSVFTLKQMQENYETKTNEILNNYTKSRYFSLETTCQSREKWA